MRALFSFFFVCALVFFGLAFWTRSLYPHHTTYYPEPERMSMWPIQSIDTMKYSRDIAREKLRDASFDAVIERQVKAIAETGATHVAIATPYDEEFVPFLRRWVNSARAHGLKVWFRGNFSGWEGWFEYPSISREEHLQKTEAFILAHPDLFQDGDAFSACPECENGGPGDPRQTGDVFGYRQFLIAEYRAMQGAFKKINKNVRANLFSMNGDVALLVMDKETTRALGGIVTIDHYVETPEQLIKDISDVALKSGGKIILGEFGVPIPDIHGSLSEAGQQQWIARALALLEVSPSVEGVSYWLSVGGSTELWNSRGEPRSAVATLTRYFKPHVAYGFVRDGLGRPVEGAEIAFGEWSAKTDTSGYFSLRYLLAEKTNLAIWAAGYESVTLAPQASRESLTITLRPTERTLYYDTAVFLHGLFIK